MASISKDPNGRRRILFIAPDGKRKTIRLGKISQRAAESFKLRLEKLVGASVAGCGWDNEIARWVAELPDTIADKLAQVGLIAARQRSTLESFLDAYRGNRTDVGSGTQTAYRQACDSLIEFFDGERDLRNISPGHADEFRVFLIEKGYAEATVSRRIKYAKQFFKAAVRKRLILADPFADLKAGKQDNQSRFHFVSLEDSAKVLDACWKCESVT